MNAPPTHVQVAIVGGGPAGIGAAVGLSRAQAGSVLLIERRQELGGIPARYKKKAGGVPTFLAGPLGPIVFGETLADRLRHRLAQTATQVWLETQVIEIQPETNQLTVLGPGIGQRQITADAALLACGARESTLAERKLLPGSRPARVLFTKNLVDWIDRHGCLPAAHPLIFGSDLVAFSAAAKLRAAGAAQPVLLDASSSIQCGWLERLYFRRWTAPVWRGHQRSMEIAGQPRIRQVLLPPGEPASCDGLILGGRLVPNSELALLGGLEVELPSRRLRVSPQGALSRLGWFAAGGMLGGFHGAHWCYLDGLRLAKQIIHFLNRDRG